MCTSYKVGDVKVFDAFSDFPLPLFDFKPEIYKDYAAPILRRAADGFSTDAATFGMVPRKRIPPGVKVFDTMNARAESVGERRSFSGAWKGLQLCLIPCERFYEPNYETGKPVRWRIGLASGESLAIAGLWRAWKDEEGESLSFTMLTVSRIGVKAPGMIAVMAPVGSGVKRGFERPQECGFLLDFATAVSPFSGIGLGLRKLSPSMTMR